MVIELAPSLAEMVFGVLPTVELVEAVPIAVGVALAGPGEIVAVTVPTVAVASTDSAGVSVVAEQRLSRLELCDRCECAARCTTPGGSATQ